MAPLTGKAVTQLTLVLAVVVALGCGSSDEARDGQPAQGSRRQAQRAVQEDVPCVVDLRDGGPGVVVRLWRA
jgi:hypothetical protein